MSDGERPAGGGWLLLIYRVPSEPSRLRSAVWRRLKRLGVICRAAAQQAHADCEQALEGYATRVYGEEPDSHWAVPPSRMPPRPVTGWQPACLPAIIAAMPS